MPMRNLQSDNRGENEKKKKNLNGCFGFFFVKVDSSVLSLTANLHLWLLLEFDGSETVHPPHFSSKGFGTWFLFSDVCCNHISVILFDHPLSMCQVSKPTTACFALSIS